MYGALFSLVNKDEGIFAWGMEVTVRHDPETDTSVTSALVYRPAMDGRNSLISVHDSAEAAHANYVRLLPIELEWEADLIYDSMS